MKCELSASNEDYLETIIMLESENGTVRVSDISKFMKVSKPSVNHAINILKDGKLINHENYGHVELTKKGRKIGEKIYNIHKSLNDFLTRILKIDKNIAAEDACKIEHYISDNTSERIFDFMEYVNSFGKKDPEWLDKFENYLDKKIKKIG